MAKTYLFEYPYGTGMYTTEVPADSIDEARARLKAMSNARYLGELQIKIPAAMPGAGLVVRAYVWLRNFLSLAP